MKKIFFSLLVLLTFSSLNAQSDSTLQEYTGKFKYPDGSPVTEIIVVIENGILSANSALGNSELKKTDTKDVFDIVSYSGVATFKRNTEGKITSLRVQVQDVDMEGEKTAPGGFVQGNFFPIGSSIIYLSIGKNSLRH